MSKSTQALIACCLLFFSIPVGAQVTTFSADVTTAIDNGLGWLDAQGVFANPSAAGDGAGLAALALMEKRESADQNAAFQGYGNANPADQARLDLIMAYIIARAPALAFYAYRDGADAMALALYLRTMGPDQINGRIALDAIFDRIAANQGAAGSLNEGYWCYRNPACPDSSTTQLVMAGLAAIRGLYADALVGDPARLATLNTLTAATRQAYIDNGKTDGSALDMVELGHGYRANYAANRNSYQQTASGLWAQLVGGADLNDASVQAYFRWEYNRYSYTTIAPANGGWNRSYFYYLWSSSKAYTFLEDSGVVPAAGNLSPDDLGVLGAADAPAFAGRQLHRDPTTDARVPSFGPEGAGYYNDANETERWYYDYAYTLLTLQNANGQFVAPPGNGIWSQYSAQSYALLVLQRSVGGGCVDTDDDGVCDADDNCPNAVNADQADADGDTLGDVCDNCPGTENLDQADADNDGVGDVCDNCAADDNADQADADQDGLGDVCDNCVDDANADQADADADTVGDVCDVCPNVEDPNQGDVDADGVGDLCDNCVDDANPDQTDTDADGLGDVCDDCPAELACGDNGVFNPESCGCDCDGDWIGDACDMCGLDACPVGQIINADACECETCAPPVDGCGEGMDFNADTCECEACMPPEGGCAPGEDFDPLACVCVPPVCDDPPTADAGADITACDGSVTLHGTGTAPCGGETFTWSVGANILGEGADLQVDLPDGDTVVTLTVCDAVGACTSDDLTVSIGAIGPWAWPDEISVAEAFNRLYCDDYREDDICGLYELASDRGTPLAPVLTTAEIAMIQPLVMDTSGQGHLFLEILDAGMMVVDSVDLFDPGAWTAPTRGWLPDSASPIIDLADVLVAAGYTSDTPFRFRVGGTVLDASNTYLIAGGEPGEFIFAHNGGGLGAGDLDANEPVLLGLAPFSAVCPEGANIIVGTTGDDMIVGTPGVDCIFGLGGDDNIRAGASDDVVFGGGGFDAINGGGGSDYLSGGTCDDNLRGRHGEDTLDGGPGDDILSGGGDNDLLSGGPGHDVVSGDGGNDMIQGNDGDDLLRGNSGNDFIEGGAGIDDIQGGSGNDEIDGGDGSDIIRGNAGRDEIRGGAGADWIESGLGFDMVDGGDGDDVIDTGLGDDIVIGGLGDDLIHAGPGDDVVEAGGGLDSVFGEEGDDSLYGEDGDDTIDGGDGFDLIRGGAGTDMCTTGEDVATCEL